MVFYKNLTWRPNKNTEVQQSTSSQVSPIIPVPLIPMPNGDIIPISCPSCSTNYGSDGRKSFKFGCFHSMCASCIWSNKINPRKEARKPGHNIHSVLSSIQDKYKIICPTCAGFTTFSPNCEWIDICQKVEELKNKKELESAHTRTQLLEETIKSLKSSKDFHECSECQHIEVERNLSICKSCIENKDAMMEMNMEEILKKAICAIRKHKIHDVIDIFPVMSAKQYSIYQEKINEDRKVLEDSVAQLTQSKSENLGVLNETKEDHKKSIISSSLAFQKVIESLRKISEQGILSKEEYEENMKSVNQIESNEEIANKRKKIEIV